MPLLDVAGNLQVTTGSALLTLTAWTPVNWTGGFTAALVTNAGCQSAIVQLDQNASITAGAVTWQGSYNGVDWATIPSQQVLDPTSSTFAQIANPYTFSVSAALNKTFLILMSGYSFIRALESTPMTGAGASITPYCTQLSYSPVTVAPIQSPLPVTGTITAVTAITNALPTGANTIGSVKITDGTTVPGVVVATTALKTDLSSVAGTATGTAASGIQKVGVVGNTGAILDGATGAAVPANGIYNGVRAATVNPGNATGGNLVGIMADKAGRLVVTSGHVRDLQGTQTTTIAASGTETTIVTAGAAGVFNDICTLVISGQSTAATVWTLRSATAGTIIASFNAPVGSTALPVIVEFNPPLAQPVAANNWTIQAGTGTSTGAQIFVQYIKNT